MAYDFLGLVNEVNDKFNEVNLTSANFASSVGYYADVKKAVNQALHRINFDEFEWPFNWVKSTTTLVVDQLEYDYPANAKTLALDTFRIKGDTTLNVETRKLKVLDYEEFLERFADAEFNPSDHSGIPEYVCRTRSLKFGLYPVPDKAYELVYEYYELPTDLTNWDDVPSVPEPFRHVIYEGALYHAYMFRGGTEEASVSNALFESLVDNMRKIYINRTEYVRSSVIPR